MITKHYLKSRPVCQVTFSFVVPGNAPVQTVCLVGDFNHWNHQAAPMVKRKGGFEVMVELVPGNGYHFRYLVNDSDWYNDDKADRYALNSFGTYNSVISV